MTVDVFLQIPGIPGSSAERDHPDWIELTGATWGVEQSSAGGAGGGVARLGKATQHPLVVSAPTSIATPLLFEAIVRGTHFASAALEVVRAGDEPSLAIRWEFEEVSLARLDVTGASPGFDDVFELRPRRVRLSVLPIDPRGAAAQPVTRGFDFTSYESW